MTEFYPIAASGLIKTDIKSPIDVKSLFTIYRVEYDFKKETSKTRKLGCYQLLCVESGVFNVTLNSILHTVNPGEMIIYSPDAIIKGVEDLPLDRESVKALIYLITFDTTASVEGDIFNRPLKLTLKQYSLLSELFTDALQIQRTHSRQGRFRGMVLTDIGNGLTLQKIKNKLELLLIDLCETVELERERSAVTKSENAQTGDLAKITEFLKANIRKELSLEEIADGCSMSVAKIKKLFTRKHEGGVINYFNSLKISHAKHLIRNTDMNFTQISEELGFSYPYYFSKVFKAKTGMSPSEYAKHIDKR